MDRASVTDPYHVPATPDRISVRDLAAMWGIKTMPRKPKNDPAYFKIKQDGYALLSPLLWYENINYDKLDSRAAKILKLSKNGIDLIGWIGELIIILNDNASKIPHDSPLKKWFWKDARNGIDFTSYYGKSWDLERVAQSLMRELKSLSRIHNELCIHLVPLDDLYSRAGQSAAEVFGQFGSSYHNAAFIAINRFLTQLLTNCWAGCEINLEHFRLEIFCDRDDEQRKSLDKPHAQYRAELYREAYKVTELMVSADVVEAPEPKTAIVRKQRKTSASRMPRDEANVKVAELLKKRPTTQKGNAYTYRKTANLVGCSSGLIRKLTAYHDYIADLEKQGITAKKSGSSKPRTIPDSHGVIANRPDARFKSPEQEAIDREESSQWQTFLAENPDREAMPCPVSNPKRKKPVKLS